MIGKSYFLELFAVMHVVPPNYTTVYLVQLFYDIAPT